MLSNLAKLCNLRAATGAGSMHELQREERGLQENKGDFIKDIKSLHCLESNKISHLFLASQDNHLSFIIISWSLGHSNAPYYYYYAYINAFRMLPKKNSFIGNGSLNLRKSLINLFFA
jgi:hypothetical protein